jgi:hypothetical protein
LRTTTPRGILPDGMKELYCWRCRIEIPMLDETEFAQVLIESTGRRVIWAAK